jgi:hypothetical protein
MALTLTIDAVTKTFKAGSLNITMTANGRATASFSVTSLDATYRPALNDEVIINEDAVRIFGGVVTMVREHGAGGGAAIVTDITAADFNVYPERRIISRAFPIGTLEDALNIIITDYLGTGFYNITLDAGQVTGPTLPALGYTVVRLDEVLNDLARLTAEAGDPYVWRINEFKELSMFQPSTEPAPFDIEDPLPITDARSDITVEHRRGPDYANRVIVFVPPTTQNNRIEAFTGDGTTDTFDLQYIPFRFRGLVTVNGVEETLSDVGGGGTWEFDSVTNTIERTTGAPGVAATITIEFDGTFTVNVAAEDAAEIAAIGLWEKLVMPDAIPDGITAQAFADAELARSKHPIKAIKYRTITPALFPGQGQVIDVARRNIVAATGVVSDVLARDLGKAHLSRDVTVIIDAAQTNLGRGWRDTIKSWSTDKRGGGGVASATTGGGTSGSGPAAPNMAVQYNAAGAFGGDAEFTYNAATNCLIQGGGGSSITASSPESCQIFGYDCHITD